MAIFRLLLLNHLSEAWFPAFVKRLFNFFALSVFEAIVLRPTVMVCKPTIGLIPFRERTTFQNFDTSAVIRELEEYTPFTCLVFRSLIHELGVKSQVTKICNESVVCFHGLIVVAAAVSLNNKRIWLRRNIRGVMAVTLRGDVATCYPEHQIHDEFSPGELKRDSRKRGNPPQSPQ